MCPVNGLRVAAVSLPADFPVSFCLTRNSKLQQKFAMVRFANRHFMCITVPKYIYRLCILYVDSLQLSIRHILFPSRSETSLGSIETAAPDHYGCSPLSIADLMPTGPLSNLSFRGKIPPTVKRANTKTMRFIFKKVFF